MKSKCLIAPRAVIAERPGHLIVLDQIIEMRQRLACSQTKMIILDLFAKQGLEQINRLAGPRAFGAQNIKPFDMARNQIVEPCVGADKRLPMGGKTSVLGSSRSISISHDEIQSCSGLPSGSIIVTDTFELIKGRI